ncbi:transporter family protein [Paenibacillaceae bacterium GAS479]|nr:transporter family protein [Paenibacillaceae bacterium GAS479]
MWLPYALLSAVFAALVSIFGKIGLKDLDANSATALRAIIMAAFLVVVVIVQGKFGQMGEIFAQRKALTFIAMSGAAGALSWLFYFLALKVGTVSQVGPIDKLSVVFAIVLAMLFLGEKITLWNGIGVVMIAVGAILTSLK